jgi:hypothetical protein
VREEDFELTIELACTQIGLEVDARMWDVFVYGDEDLRRATAVEIQQNRNKGKLVFSEELSRRIDQLWQGQLTEVPKEVLQRMAQLRLTCRKPCA